MTARINLLPWRQRRRDRQRRAFLAQVGIASVGATFLVALSAIVLDGRIDNQDTRNRFLLESIDELERRIDAIEVVQRRTDETMARLRAFSGLRRDRTGTVRLFDELARTVAPGIHYTAVARSGTLISARGIARSNNDISTLMRSLQESEGFEAPKLKGIEEIAGNVDVDPSVAFEITFATSVADLRDANP